MKWIKLTPTSTRNRNLDFLVKLPVLPNKFWFNKHSYSIVIHKPDEEGEPYYLATDHEDFLKSYDEYYRERFEVEVLETPASVPAGYSTLIEIGDNTSPSETANEGKSENSDDTEILEEQEETKRESVS